MAGAQGQSPFPQGGTPQRGTPQLQPQGVPPQPAAPQQAMPQQPAFPQQPPVFQGHAPAPEAFPPQPAVQRYHVHHSYIWLGSIQTAIVFLIVGGISAGSSLVGALAEGGRPDVGGIPVLLIAGLLALGALVVIAGLVALYQWASYKHLYYELGPEEFNLYSGIFNKKRVHIPYQRIQSVDQRASLVQRIFGVCTVSIDTAGGSANKAVTVPYVQKSQAEALRRELFSRKQYQVCVQNGADPALAAAAYAQAVAAAAPLSAPAAAAGVPGAAAGTVAVPAAAAGAAPIPVAGAVPPPANAAPGTPGAGQAPGNVLDAPAEVWESVRGVFAGMHVDTGKVTYEYGMSNKELVLTGVSNNTAFLIVAIGLIGGIVQFASQLMPFLFGGPGESVLNDAFQAGSRLLGGNLVLFGVVLFLGVAVVVWVFSALASCISYGGFRACRRDNRIEVEHGLLQHRIQGVDVDRVQSVVVKQSFVRRLMGYCELSLGKIDAATEGSNDQQQSALNAHGLVIHPFVKLDRVPEILSGIIPEFADVPVDNKPVARVALRRALIRRCIVQGTGFWLAVLVGIAQVLLNAAFDPSVSQDAATLYAVNLGAGVVYVLCVVLLALDAVGAVLWYRGSGFSYNERFMQVSNGGFAREIISFPRRKIQFGYAKTNPFQRRARTATVNARTAAGIGGTTIRLIDVCEEDAGAWLEWLKPRGNVVQ